MGIHLLMRYLFLILLLLPVLGWGDDEVEEAVMGVSGIEWDVMQCASSPNGLTRQTNKMASIGADTIAIIGLNASSKNQFCITTNFSSWGSGDLDTQVTAEDGVGMIWSWGDSSFATTAYRASGSYLGIQKYNATGTSQDSLDWPNGSSTTTTLSRSAIATVSRTPDSLLLYHLPETGTTDTAGAFVQAFKGAAGAARRVDLINTGYLVGSRVPFYWSGGVGGGIALHSLSVADLFWVDASNGFDTISTNIPGVSYYTNNRTFDMKPIKDSFFMIVAQRAVTAADSLSWWLYHIGGTHNANGTATLVADDSSGRSGSGGAILKSGNVNNGSYSEPCISVLRNTNRDTVICYFKYWPVQTVADSFRICYRIGSINWTTEQISWSSIYIFKECNTGNPAADSAINLHSPPELWRKGENIQMAVAYEVGITIDPDTIKCYLGNLNTSLGVNSLYRYNASGVLQYYNAARAGTRHKP